LIKKDHIMNIKLFKTKIITLITAITLVAGVSLVYGFSSSDKPRDPKKLPLTTSWYSVTITGSPASNPANQQIGAAISSSPTAPCNELSGLVCAIQLTLDDGVTKPTTVAQANTMEANNEGVDVGSSSFREED